MLRPLLTAAVLAALTTSAFAQTPTLLDARRGFETEILGTPRVGRSLAEPPSGLFSLVEYDTDLGPMEGYLHQPAETDDLAPAIVWLTGGFPTARGGTVVWNGTPDNDQSAAAFRLEDVAMFFPTVRGTGLNPGVQETFWGEVNDVMAAGEFVSELEFVDPERIYLGGHSTGGTLALLVAEATDLFHAVFAFGPASDASHYGTMTFQPDNPEEYRLRSPIHFLDAVRSPTWVIEGEYGRSGDLAQLREATSNPAVHCITVPGADHFDVLFPLNRHLAQRVAACRETPFSVDPEALTATYADFRRSQRRLVDLGILARMRRAGASLDAPHVLRYVVPSDARDVLEDAATRLEAEGFTTELTTFEEGNPPFSLTVDRVTTLDDSEAVHAITAAFDRVCQSLHLIRPAWEATPRDG